MRFLSKITFICNACFIAVVLLLLYKSMYKEDSLKVLMKVQRLESTLAILGYGAIIVNIIFHIMLLIGRLSGNDNGIAKWIIWFNFLLLIFQVYYFFFS